MRWFALIALAVLLSGCAQPKSPDGSATAQRPARSGAKSSGSETNKPAVIVTPSTAVSGKVILVRATARYVVINYPIGTVPPIDQHLNVYRNGLKVGELKVTGPRFDVNIAADITAGDCQIGDEVKSE